MNQDTRFHVARGRQLLNGWLGSFIVVVCLFQSGCSNPSEPARPVFERNSEGRVTAVYVGDIVNGVPHGTGIKYWLDPQGKPLTCYFGDWRNGLQSGAGVRLMFDRGSPYVVRVYNGSWLLDRQEGYGAQIRFRSTVFPDNILVYQGQFKRGRMHGDGHLQTFESDGSLYDAYSGEFRDGFPVDAAN